LRPTREAGRTEGSPKASFARPRAGACAAECDPAPGRHSPSRTGLSPADGRAPLPRIAEVGESITLGNQNLAAAIAVHRGNHPRLLHGLDESCRPVVPDAE